MVRNREMDMTTKGEHREFGDDGNVLYQLCCRLTNLHVLKFIALYKKSILQCDTLKINKQYLFLILA